MFSLQILRILKIVWKLKSVPLICENLLLFTFKVTGHLELETPIFEAIF